MSVIGELQRVREGSHYRAFSLCGLKSAMAPFVNVDHVWICGPAGPVCQHTNAPYVSYLFPDSETGLRIREVSGVERVVRPGGISWTTSGQHALAEQAPLEPGKTVHAVHVGVSLTSVRDRMATAPCQLAPEDIPADLPPGGIVRVLAGAYGAARSSLELAAEITMLDIALNDMAEVSIPVPPDHCAMLLPVSGTMIVDGQSFDPAELQLPILPAREEPYAACVGARHGAAQVMLLMGCPSPRIRRFAG